LPLIGIGDNSCYNHSFFVENFIKVVKSFVTPMNKRINNLYDQSVLIHGISQCKVDEVFFVGGKIPNFHERMNLNGVSCLNDTVWLA